MKFLIEFLLIFGILGTLFLWIISVKKVEYITGIESLYPQYLLLILDKQNLNWQNMLAQEDGSHNKSMIHLDPKEIQQQKLEWILSNKKR